MWSGLREADVLCWICVCRTHAERSAAPDARSGGLRDPAAGQLPRILHSGHALPDGRDSGRERVLRAGGHELVRPVVRRRSGEVRQQRSWRFLWFISSYKHVYFCRYLAEWITYGYPSASVWPLDISRFGNLQSSRTFLRHRVMEVMREYYSQLGIVYILPILLLILFQGCDFPDLHIFRPLRDDPCDSRRSKVFLGGGVTTW